MRSALLLATLMLTTVPALAEKAGHDPHNHHDHGDHEKQDDSLGAHSHGQAQLQLAMEGGSVDLFFTSPAVNLLGFEHALENEQQQAALEKVLNYFRTLPLLHTEGGECQVSSATVESPLMDKNHQGGHSDITVTQTLACDPPLSGHKVDAAVMTDWPGIEQLEVEWVGDSGQGSERLDQSRTLFRP